MKATRWLVLTAAVTLAACGGDDNGSTGPGNGGQAFKADVTGDVQTSIKGDAAYGQVDDPDLGKVFAIEMAETNPGGLIQLVRLGGVTPSAGTYTIADALNGTPQDGEFAAVAWDMDNGAPAALFVATGGQIKITGSGSMMKGTFSFDAEGGLFSDPTTTLRVTVTGSFTAAKASQALRVTSATIRRSR